MKQDTYQSCEESDCLPTQVRLKYGHPLQKENLLILMLIARRLDDAELNSIYRQLLVWIIEVVTDADRRRSYKILFKILATVFFIAFIVALVLLALKYRNYNQLQEKHSQLEHNYSNLQANYSYLEHRYNRLQTNYSQLEEEHSSLQANYTQMEHRYRGLQGNCHQFEEGLNGLQTNCTQLEEGCNDLQANYSKLKERHNSLQANYSQLEEGCNNLQVKYRQLEKERNDVQANYSQLEERHKDLQAIVINLKEIHINLQENCSQLEEGHSELQANYSELEERHNGLQANHSQLEEGHNSLQANQSQLKEGHNSLQANQSQLKEGHNELQANYSELEERHINLQANDGYQNKNYDQLLFMARKLLNILIDGGIKSHCPPGWLNFNKTCYYFSTEWKDWYGANSSCMASNSTLAMVTTKAQQDFIAKQDRVRRWIGLTDLGQVGVYVWVNGKQLKNGFWARGEPNNQGVERCVTKGTQFHPYKWNNDLCFTEHHWICQVSSFEYLARQFGLEALLHK